MAVAASPGLSRRDFVAMLLGAPAAASLGCGKHQVTRYDGRLIDTGRVRGHAALVAAWPGTGASPVAIGSHPQRTVDVAIIGGGVAGLAAAWALRRAGVRDVLVLELADAIGGTARGEDGIAPWGAHYIVAPQQDQHDLIALLADMGAIEGWSPAGEPIVDEALRCRAPEERLYYRGRWYPGLYLRAGASAEDLEQLRRFEALIDHWVSWRDSKGRRAFCSPISACSDDAEVAALDRESFASWLDRHQLTSPRLRWLTDYACRDDYALTAKENSAWAGVFYFASRKAKPGGEPQPVVTWPDGNASLVRHLAAGIEFQLSTAVTSATASADAVTLHAMGPSGSLTVRARHCIAAVPSFVARRIVPTAAMATPPALPDTGAWVVANLTLRGRPAARLREAAPSWDNVLYDSPSLGYISATHQLGRDHGATVWTWYYPFTDGISAEQRRQLESASWQEWAEVAVADLARPHPELPQLVKRVDVAMWGHGMVRPRVGSMFAQSRLQRAKPAGRIHFAHTDLSGVALFEEALDQGMRAAREVLMARAP